MQIKNDPKSGFRSGREMLACLSAVILLVLLTQATRLVTDSEIIYALVAAAIAVIGGFAGWTWQRWGRARFPLKSVPRLQPARVVRLLRR